MDDDCAPDSGWLKVYLDAFAEAPDCALAGPIANGLPDDDYAEAYHLIFGYLFSRHVARSGGESAAPFDDLGQLRGALPIRSVPSAASTKRFDWRPGLERLETWVRTGKTFLAVPEAIVYHRRPLTLASFLAQQYRYGRGGMIFRRALDERGWSGTGFDRDRSTAIGLLTAFHHPARRRVRLFVLLMLSQVAIAAGYAGEYGRQIFLRLLDGVKGSRAIGLGPQITPFELVSCVWRPQITGSVSHGDDGGARHEHGGTSSASSVPGRGFELSALINADKTSRT